MIESYQDDVIYRAFVQPFQDVIDTAKHGIQTVSATTVRNVIKIAKQQAPLFLPLMSKSVSEVGKIEQKKLEAKLAQIDKQYADVLKRNWDTLRTRDISFIMFMMNPKMYLGASMALKAPEAAFDILDSFVNNATVSRWHSVFKDLSRKSMPPVGNSGGGSGGMGGSSGDYFGGGGEGTGWESKKIPGQVIKEAPSKEDIDKKAAVTIGRLLKDKDVQQQLATSPVIKQMRQAALQIFLEKASEVSKFNSVENFKNFFGTEFDKIYQQIIKSAPQEEQEIKKLDDAIVVELKQLYKQMILNYFISLKQQVPEAAMEIQKASDTLQRML